MLFTVFFLSIFLFLRVLRIKDVYYAKVYLYRSAVVVFNSTDYALYPLGDVSR